MSTRSSDYGAPRPEAYKPEFSVLEAETILQELHETIVDVVPVVQNDLNLDAIDAQVDIDDDKLTE